nr:MAG TPA_asm: hypothetical protein [Caudoviricetes sp.]
MQLCLVGSKRISQHKNRMFCATKCSEKVL